MGKAATKKSRLFNKKTIKLKNKLVRMFLIRASLLEMPNWVLPITKQMCNYWLLKSFKTRVNNSKSQKGPKRIRSRSKSSRAWDQTLRSSQMSQRALQTRRTCRTIATTFFTMPSSRVSRETSWATMSNWPKIWPTSKSSWTMPSSSWRKPNNSL